MLAPPSIAKLNGDETYDIIAQNFDGKITAIDGEDFDNIIWEVNIEGTESALLQLLVILQTMTIMEMFLQHYMLEDSLHTVIFTKY